jgi:hypothetical protein
MAISRVQRLQQLRDRLALIAARFEVGLKLKWHPIILAQHRQCRWLLCWRGFHRNRISEIANIAEDCASIYARRV